MLIHIPILTEKHGKMNSKLNPIVVKVVVDLVKMTDMGLEMLVSLELFDEGRDGVWR